MGKVTGNWLTGKHSGSACHHDDLYTKINKKTGACYSVKLCNPSTAVTENQIAQRSEFGNINAALSAWVKTNKEESGANHADYLTVMTAFKRQKTYSTLRGYLYAKGKYTIDDSGNVTVDINANTAHSGSSSSGSSSSGSSSSTTTKYTLTLVASPTAGGRVTGGGQFTAGSSVSVTATANSGYTFTSWSDGITTASRTVTLNSNQTLTANFTSTGAGGSDDDEEGSEA